MGLTFEEHLSNLSNVFTQLASAGLSLKPSKCKLVRGEVDFLGYVVLGNGISTDPKKVTAVTKLPRLTDLRPLRAFLGLMSYYRRFVPRFSSMAQPVYSLTLKDVLFKWSGECETGFTHLKTSLKPIRPYWLTLNSETSSFLKPTHQV